MGTTGYDWSYVYDDGGNRILKKEAFPTDPPSRFEEVYVYDISDPATYGTANNRLMKITRTGYDTEPGGELLSSGGIV